MFHISLIVTSDLCWLTEEGKPQDEDLVRELNRLYEM